MIKKISFFCLLLAGNQALVGMDRCCRQPDTVNVSRVLTSCGQLRSLTRLAVLSCDVRRLVFDHPVRKERFNDLKDQLQQAIKDKNEANENLVEAIRDLGQALTDLGIDVCLDPDGEVVERLDIGDYRPLVNYLFRLRRDHNCFVFEIMEKEEKLSLCCIYFEEASRDLAYWKEQLDRMREVAETRPRFDAYVAISCENMTSSYRKVFAFSKFPDLEYLSLRGWCVSCDDISYLRRVCPNIKTIVVDEDLQESLKPRSAEIDFASRRLERIKINLIKYKPTLWKEFLEDSDRKSRAKKS